MQEKEFDQELLKRLKQQRKLLEDTAYNLPLPSPNGKRCVKIAKKAKKEKNEPTRKK